MTISSEAASWASRRLDHESWTAADESDFRVWLAANPAHGKEYRKCEEALRTAGALAGDSALGEEIERVLTLYSDRGDPVRSWGLRMDRRRWIAVGAATAAAVAAGAWFAWRAFPFARTYRTGLAERRPVVLEDGSRVVLDAQTRLVVRFGAELRSVRLESGRASFEVASEPSRPFEVVAGNRRVKVVGTVFDVQHIDRGDLGAAGGAGPSPLVEVSVREGIVEFGGGGESPKVRLTEGLAASWGADEGSPTVAEFPVEQFGAWRSGRLVYRERPFRYVLADLQREYPGEFVLSDPSLGEMPVTGTIRTSDLSEAFKLLAEVLPIAIHQDTDGTVTIARRFGP